jgi:hypothetical protein
MGIAPGAINIAIVDAYLPMHLPIGNLTITGKVLNGLSDPDVAFVIQRAWEITHLEQVEGTKFGYTMKTNWIVGWLLLNLGNSSGIVQYPSDVIHYRHLCRWVAPALNELSGTWEADGASWVVWNDGSLFQSPNAGRRFPDQVSTLCSILSLAIFPLINTNSTQDGMPIFTFLFLGGNNSLTLN